MAKKNPFLEAYEAKLERNYQLRLAHNSEISMLGLIISADDEGIEDVGGLLFRYIETKMQIAKDIVSDSKDDNVGDKWIPVTERLPESGKHVLVACKTPMGQYVCDGYYCSYHSLTGGVGDDFATIYDEDDDEYYLMPGWYEVIKNWDDYNSITIYDTVTHWMPLPEPPKEVSDD